MLSYRHDGCASIAIQRRRDRPADHISGAANRISVEVGVTLRGRRLRVSEKLADDRQSEARAGADTRKRMAEIVDAQPFEISRLGDGGP